MPARRALPMSPEDLLEAAVLVYLRGLGIVDARRRRPRRSATASAGLHLTPSASALDKRAAAL